MGLLLYIHDPSGEKVLLSMQRGNSSPRLVGSFLAPLNPFI